MKIWLACILSGLTAPIQAQTMLLTNDGKPIARIYIPGQPSVVERQAAAVLQNYVYKISGASLSIAKETAGIQTGPGIFIGNTAFGGKAVSSSLPGNDGFIIQSTNNNLVLRGGGSKGILYAAYTFIEKYLKCYKWDAGPAIITRTPTIIIPAAV